MYNITVFLKSKIYICLEKSCRLHQFSSDPIWRGGFKGFYFLHDIFSLCFNFSQVYITYMIKSYYIFKNPKSLYGHQQWSGYKLGKEYVKAVYCHPPYLTYM